MIISIALDRNYLEFAAVMLHSLARFGQVADCPIAVLCDGLTDDDKRVLSEASDSDRIRFVDLTGAVKRQIADLKSTTNWPTTVYACVLAADILEDVSGRLLMLDCDILVRDSLRPLIDLPLDGKAVGAVRIDKDAAFLATVNRRLGLPETTPYFNSGALLIDIGHWRRAAITPRALAWASSHADQIVYPDQDALNYALAGDFMPLDPRWNCYGKSWDTSDAAVIHFVYSKPNRADSQHPAKDLWLECRKGTAFASRALVTPWDISRRRWAKKLKALLPARSNA